MFSPLSWQVKNPSFDSQCSKKSHFQTHPAVRCCAQRSLEVVVTGERNERCHEENANSGRLHLSALASFPGGLYGLRHACLNVCILRATGMDQRIRGDLLHWVFCIPPLAVGKIKLFVVFFLTNLNKSRYASFLHTLSWTPY